MILAPGLLWYSIFLLLATLLQSNEKYFQWLVLNLGLAGCLYWIATQLVFAWGARSSIIAAAMGLLAAKTSCSLAMVLFYQGGNPCHFFPGAYYGNNASRYYALEAYQDCQQWIAITYLSALVWAVVVAPSVGLWLRRDPDLCPQNPVR